jgi:spore coat polysaccharide biosynthesis protein SpsF
LRVTALPIIVATTNDGSEKPIVDYCRDKGLLYFCGDEQNVLKRFYECAQKYAVTTIIRVTSDCPLIDGEIILKGLKAYQHFDENTYYSNAIDRTYPRGMDYEIFSLGLLKNAYEHARDASDLEHVTPYIWKNKSGKVTLQGDKVTPGNSDMRITLDTVEDEMLLRILIERYHADTMDCAQIVELLNANPQLREINKLVEQKKLR